MSKEEEEAPRPIEPIISKGAISYVRRGSEPPPSMPSYADTHEAWKSKGTGYKTKKVFDNFLTSDNYEDSLIFDMRFFSKVLIHIKEIGGTKAIKYKVLACLDPSIWEALKSDVVVSASGSAVETLSDAWNWVKIQVASNVSGQAGKINAFIEGKTP